MSSLNCPYCQQELAVGAAECPKCQLNLNRIHEKLSPVPILRSGLNDTSELLTPRQRESLNKSLDHFSKNLVQSHIHILIRQFSPEFPLSSHLFWIFNKGGLTIDPQKLSQSRDILIGLDPAQKQLALTWGYGLETYFDHTPPPEIFQQVQEELAGSNYHKALETLVAHLLQHLLNSETSSIDETAPASQTLDY